MSQIDILNIDDNIKEEFKEELKNLDKERDRIEDMRKTIKNMDKNEKKSINKLRDSIEKLEKYIISTESETRFNYYIIETTQLLEEYKKILKTPVKLSFVGKTVRTNKVKHSIILEYISIAQRYSKINIKIPNKDNIVICNNCENKKLFDIIDNSVYICLLCGSQQEVILHTSSFKDIERINISSKYTYDRKVHFRDCINQYQGFITSLISIPLFPIFFIFLIKNSFSLLNSYNFLYLKIIKNVSLNINDSTS